LGSVIQAAGSGGATVAGLLARKELADARQAVVAARTGLSGVVNVTTKGNVDEQLATMNAGLSAEGTRLVLTPPPASVVDLSKALEASQRTLANLAKAVATAPIFLGRVQQVRRSTLDSGQAETA